MDEVDKELLRRTSKKTKKQLVAEYYEIAERTHALTMLGMPSKLRKRSGGTITRSETAEGITR